MRAVFAVLMLLAACTDADGGLVLKDGYGGQAAPCRAIGGFFTNDPGDTSPDLVACPTGVAPPPAGRVWPLGTEDGFETYYLVP